MFWAVNHFTKKIAKYLLHQPTNSHVFFLLLLDYLQEIWEQICLQNICLTEKLRWSILAAAQPFIFETREVAKEFILVKKILISLPIHEKTEISFNFTITESRLKEILLLLLQLFIKVALQLIRFILKKTAAWYRVQKCHKTFPLQYRHTLFY